MFHHGPVDNVQKCLFALPDKHFFSTTFLEFILEITGQCQMNDKASKKVYSDMIIWYIAFRMRLLALILKLFKTTKKTQQ